MSYYSYGFDVVVECCCVCCYVYSVCEAADYYDVGVVFCELCYCFRAPLAAVRCWFSCAYDADNFRGVVVCCSAGV